MKDTDDTREVRQAHTRTPLVAEGFSVPTRILVYTVLCAIGVVTLALFVCLVGLLFRLTLIIWSW